jgi:hypothetical protein
MSSSSPTTSTRTVATFTPYERSGRRTTATPELRTALGACETARALAYSPNPVGHRFWLARRIMAITAAVHPTSRLLRGRPCRRRQVRRHPRPSEHARRPGPECPPQPRRVTCALIGAHPPGLNHGWAARAALKGAARSWAEGAGLRNWRCCSPRAIAWVRVAHERLVQPHEQPTLKPSPLLSTLCAGDARV